MQYSDIEEILQPLVNMDMSQDQKVRILEAINSHSWERSVPIRGSKKPVRRFRYAKAWGSAAAALILAGAGIEGVLHRTASPHTQSNGDSPQYTQGDSNKPADGPSKTVAWTEVPSQIQLTVKALQDLDPEVGSYKTPAVTETTVNHEVVYHIILSGQFTDGTRDWRKFELSIPSGDNVILSLQAYTTNDKLLWEKSNVPVINENKVFSGASADWKATYSVTSSSIPLEPPGSYTQSEQDGYQIQYTGPSPSSVGTVWYTFDMVNTGMHESAQLPASGLIAHSIGSGTYGGKLISYKGINASLTMNWNGQQEQMALTDQSP